MKDQRVASIDAFRGFAVICMVIGNVLLGLVWIPTWLKHAPDIGFTFVDLGAPAFMFVIGLNYVSSVQRRLEKDGALQMTLHFVVRYFAILGIGALFGAGQALFQIEGVTVNWGVLQAIGTAGLVTLIFIRLPGWQRLLIGLGLLAFYQVMLDKFWLATVLASPHGGMYGSLSWSALLILSTVLADLYYQLKNGVIKLLGASSLSILAALVLLGWCVISKNRVSASYILLTLGLSGWFFCLFTVLIDRLGWNLSWFRTWGRNPLLLYVLSLLLQGLLTLPLAGWFGAQTPAWLVFIQVALLLGVLTWLARLLDRRKIFISL